MSNMRQIIEERLQALEPEFFDFEDEAICMPAMPVIKAAGITL